MLHLNFIKPQYGSRCFADIPQTINYLLTGSGQPALSRDLLSRFDRQFETVIFFFIDAFGWRFFEQHRDQYPFLQRMLQEGRVSKIASQFPSTTAAHTTTIHTGLPVGQSGVYEWIYYEPALDAIIAPLLFSFSGTTRRDLLKSTKIAPETLYPNTTVYAKLAQQGVQSFILQHREYTPSTFSDVVFRGAETVPYNTLPEALINLQLLLKRQQQPSYYFLYFDKIDALSHKYGPSSPQVAAEIDTFLTLMERLFAQKLAGKQRDTLFIMSADHGQIDVDPETTIYLDRDPHFAGFNSFLKTDHQGIPLVPAGSPRDFFLYIHDEQLDAAQHFLAERLGDRATVVKVQELINRNYFGSEPPSDAFLSRVGNLLILPHRNGTVWWFGDGTFESPHRGLHGGLTREEAEIPLCLYDFG